MTRCCVNEVDVFTMKDYYSLPHPIILLIGKHHHFYDLISIFEWTHVRKNRYDPSTRVTFTVHQLRKIRKRYEKMQSSSSHFYVISECLKLRLDELKNWFNAGELLQLPEHDDILNAAATTNIVDTIKDQMAEVCASLPRDIISGAVSLIKSGNFDDIDFSCLDPKTNEILQNIVKDPTFPSIASLLIDEIMPTS
jgi:hypothetical protein